MLAVLVTGEHRDYLTLFQPEGMRNGNSATRISTRRVKMGYRLNGGCPGKRGQSTVAVTELVVVEIRCGYVILEWRVIKR